MAQTINHDVSVSFEKDSPLFITFLIMAVIYFLLGSLVRCIYLIKCRKVRKRKRETRDVELGQFPHIPTN